MANLMDLLKSQLTQQTVSQLSQHIGGAKDDNTAAAAQAVFSTLLGALNNQTNSQQGAQSLNQALEEDHNGDILNNVMELFGGNTAHMPNRMTDGMGILKHLLGGRKEEVAETIGNRSGLDKGQIVQMMITLAPLVMGALGKKKREQNAGSDMLGILLGNEVRQVEENENKLGGFARLLDKDGDGSIADDILDLGQGFLGGMFGKK